MKLVVVRKHCTVRYDRRTREYRLSKTGGTTVLVWSKAYQRYVLGHRCIVEVGCPFCGSRRGVPCKSRGQYHGWTHHLRRLAAMAQRKERALMRDCNDAADVSQSRESRRGMAHKRQPTLPARASLFVDQARLRPLRPANAPSQSGQDLGLPKTREVRPMLSTHPKIGDVVERDGLRFTVTHVMPRLTPYKRANQDTRVEGWTLGLRRFHGVSFDLVDELTGERRTVCLGRRL